MYQRKFIFIISTFIFVGAFIIARISFSAQAGEELPNLPAAERTGAWVDTIQISEVSSSTDAITQLETGTLDFYAPNIHDADLYQQVKSNADLAYFSSANNYNELMFNPVGPTFDATGKLNPFSVPAIREAMNWLINRNYIVQTIEGGLGIPKYLVIKPGEPEYARYPDTVETLETRYAFDPTHAEAVISSEMIKLGATKVNGLWRYNSEPVTLIFIIRVEDKRLQMGDYIANQLEGIGFTVDRQYKTSMEASPIWLNSDPQDGLWHMYTGGWVSTAISRDDSSVFADFYTPLGMPYPAWQAYDPAPEFYEAAERLKNGDFASMAERDQLFTEALTLSMEDSAHVWLTHNKSFSPRRADTTAAYDQASGLLIPDLWPFTIRRLGQEGGTLNIGTATIFNDPWNPIGGSTWGYDQFVQRATEDEGVVADPQTGLAWPQRIESANIYVETGTYMTKTLDWVTLTFSDTIEVPDDAWVDWDATNQVWITAGEKFTQTQTARVKSVVQYPTDLFTTTTWHDSSPISVGDFVMAMIMPFDMSSPASAIYDESLVDSHENFKSTFKGYRITSTDPLVIEYYTDASMMDAELRVQALWPNYGRGEGAWHVMALGYLAESNGDLAFTSAKADADQIDWMDFIGEPSISILKSHLDQAQLMHSIPYYNTLNNYISPAETTTRWSNLQTWYTNQGHFWVGTGPFYLDEVSYGNGTATLQRNPVFPDLASKWERFSHDATPANLMLNYTTGAPSSAFNVTGANFPINSVVWIYVNYQLVGTTFTGATGEFTFTLTSDALASEGDYIVTVSVNPTVNIKYQIDAQEPVHPIEGDFKVIDVPETIVGFTDYIYLPLVLH